MLRKLSSGKIEQYASYKLSCHNRRSFIDKRNTIKKKYPADNKNKQQLADRDTRVNTELRSRLKPSHDASDKTSVIYLCHFQFDPSANKLLNLLPAWSNSTVH